MPPAFFYFDLGNVLLNFRHERGAKQMAELAGVSYQQVWDMIFAGDLEERCERGDLDPRGLYEIFCRETNTRPDFDQLEQAGSDIFTLNRPIVPLVGHLAASGARLGILSNTSDSHWRFVTQGRYGLLPGPFQKLVLSFEVRSMKPERRIYEVAIEQAGVPAGEIFFVDDRADNVAGAVAAGLDAVQFVSVRKLAQDLAERGVRTNY